MKELRRRMALVLCVILSYFAVTVGFDRIQGNSLTDSFSHYTIRDESIR